MGNEMNGKSLGPAPQTVLEVCVDNVAGLEAALAGGADRVELCAALDCGGLTPSHGLMRAAAQAPIPVYAMIRPRSGSFVFSGEEAAVMAADIAAAREARLAGVVLGACLPDGQLDCELLRKLCDAASGLEKTLHRAFDLVPDHAAALEQAVTLGFGRILTSGGALSAIAGLEQLTNLVQVANGRIAIMPGGGVRPELVASFWQAGIREFHASCSAVMEEDPRLVSFGFQRNGQSQTSVDAVRKLALTIRDLRDAV